MYRLSAAASSTLEEVKTQGRAGLEYSIGQKKVFKVYFLIAAVLCFVIVLNMLVSFNCCCNVSGLGYGHPCPFSLCHHT